MERRSFLTGTVSLVGLSALAGCQSSSERSSKEPALRISLAQWSLNKRLFGKEPPPMNNLDFAATARGFGIEAVEYVNQFFMDKAKDTRYLKEMKTRAAEQGVRGLLIMCDNEGNLGDPDTAQRRQAVLNHYKWVEAAKYLGCHSIRVNARSDDKLPAQEQAKLAADGLAKLSDYAKRFGMNVLVENHGGLSSNGQWLAGVIRSVGMPNCGTLPDFGNFGDYDRYQGVEELMPFAKGVSAKSMNFDEQGNETTIDYTRMVKIVRAAGYRGYIGIEYEGAELSEMDGIARTKRLLERVIGQA
jgi:L-ribulose-5-phosphate 3-epimerase